MSSNGDIAVRDEEGLFFIVDRKKDMIVSGGFNVFPREIEDVLSTHLAISACKGDRRLDERRAAGGKGRTVGGEAWRAGGGRRARRCAGARAQGSVHAPKSIDVIESLPLDVCWQASTGRAATRPPGRLRAVGSWRLQRSAPRRLY